MSKPRPSSKVITTAEAIKCLRVTSEWVMDPGAYVTKTRDAFARPVVCLHAFQVGAYESLPDLLSLRTTRIKAGVRYSIYLGSCVFCAHYTYGETCPLPCGEGNKHEFRA
jgi:hypothetical protein